MTIMRGDSYLIPITLTQGGNVLTPEMVKDVEIFIGKDIARKMSDGNVFFDAGQQKWFVRPTQAESLALETDDAHDVFARIKYTNDPADVKIVRCGSIRVDDTPYTEEI